MTTATHLTLREQIEDGHKALAEMSARIEGFGDRATSDDWAALETKTAEVAGLLNQYDKETATRGVQGRARALLDQLTGDGSATRIDTAPGRFDALASSTGVANPAGMTIGEAFVNSPAYKDLLDKAGNEGIGHLGGKSTPVNFGVSLATEHRNLIFEQGADGRPRNALITGLSDTSAGAFANPVHLPGVTDTAPFRELTLWDLCTKIPIQSDVFDYVELNAKTNNAAFVKEATSSAVIDGTTVTAVLGGLKPESTMTFVVRTVTVENIAHLTYITRRAAADAPQLMAIINTFLRQGLAVKIEDQLLSGNGTSPNLRGIVNTGVPYSLNTFDMSVNSETSWIKAVARAQGVVRGQGFRPTAMVINSADWFSSNFLLATDTAGQYLIGDPRATLDQLNSIWGLRVVVSDGIAAGTILIGDFTYALIGDREQAALYMSDSNRDLFERNILTLLAEQRLGFGVQAPKAFCTVVA